MNFLWTQAFPLVFFLFISIRDEALRTAAALEIKSSHPIAASIVSHFSGCMTNKIEETGAQVGLPEVSKFKNEPGKGLTGILDGKHIAVGNIKLLEAHDIVIDKHALLYQNDCHSEGMAVVFIAVDQQLRELSINKSILSKQHLVGAL